MLRKVGLISSALILAIIVYATVVPIGFRPKTGHVHVERIVAYIMLGGSFTVGFPRRPVTVAVWLVTVACGLEYMQNFIPTRDARLFDAFEKSVGALIGVAAGAAFNSAVRNWKPDFR